MYKRRITGHPFQAERLPRLERFIYVSSTLSTTNIWQHMARQDTNAAKLEQAGSFSIHFLLSQHTLQWLEHVHRMRDGRIP